MSVRAIRIESGTGLAATFVPEAGMIGISLRHDGEELLGQRRGLGSYVESGKTMGLPILYPWANRLSQDEYESGGRRVRIEPGAFGVRRDANDLPIHGTLAASPLWTVEDTSAGGRQEMAHLRARFEFGDHPEFLATFPFPHRLELEIKIEGDRLTIATTVTSTGDAAVPLAYGFHPYLSLPGSERSGWLIELPEGEAIDFDDRGIPTGATRPVAPIRERLGNRSYDDGFTGLPPGSRFSVADRRRRIVVELDRGYGSAQVFAPAGENLICFEPMKAPTDALVSGRGLTAVAPGEVDVSVFSITVGAPDAHAPALSRRTGYRIDRKDPAGEVRRVARGRVESALSELRTASRDARSESVHGARRDLKKLRAVLRLVRQDLGKETFRSENRRYRDAARLLAASRDAEVLVETAESLVESYPPDAPPADPLIGRLRERRDRVEGVGDPMADRLAGATGAIESGAHHIGDWSLTESDWLLLAAGLRRTYRDGRRRMADVEAEATPEAVHEWRKRVKDLWYQLRLLRGAWPAGLKATVRETGLLAELLGDYNDLSVLIDELERNFPEDPAVPPLRSIAIGRQVELLEEALPLGRRIYAEKPGRFTDRIGAYWSS